MREKETENIKHEVLISLFPSLKTVLPELSKMVSVLMENLQMQFLDCGVLFKFCEPNFVGCGMV